jgi:hypothetical protein
VKPLEESANVKSGFGHLEAVRQDILNDLDFLRYHSLLAFERLRISLMIAYTRAQGQAREEAMVERMVAAFEKHKKICMELFRTAETLDRSHRKEADEENRKQLQAQLDTVTKSLRVSLKRANALDIVDIEDLDAAAGELRDVSDELQQRKRRQMLAKTIAVGHLTSLSLTHIVAPDRLSR